MKDILIPGRGKSGSSDPVYHYILTAAGIVFLHIILGRYVQAIYEGCLVIPCLLFLGACRERKMGAENRYVWVLPLAMVAWFCLLQVRRGISYDVLYNMGLFLSSYLFAFPLASLLRDGDTKKALKIFAGAYLAAAAILTAEGLLLVLECLPAFMSETVKWDGARLRTSWHPNIAACFLMIGTIFATAFLAQVRSRGAKLGICTVIALLLGTMALTNCRTAILLTGGYLGVMAFFRMIRFGRRWVLPGILAVVAITVVFFMAAGWLYQGNHDRMVRKYVEQYSRQEESEAAVSETEALSIETPDPELSDDQETEPDDSQEETIPLKVDSDTGDISLKTDSAQKSIAHDFETMNNRTGIWGSALYALRESRDLLLWGIGDPGWYVSQYNEYEITHLHNAWMQCLVGMGFPGFLIAAAFTLLTLWNCLIVLIKHHQDIWKRTVTLLALCLMAASCLEPYLFYTTSSYHALDFLFFLCAGYLVHWQREDNCRILTAIRSRLPFLK